MKNYFKWVLLASLLSQYPIGNNQIVKANTVADMRSEATISFDKTYIPPENIDGKNTSVIPNGTLAIASNDSNKILPKTGETLNFNLQLLGLSFLALSFLILIMRKKIGEKNEKNK